MTNENMRVSDGVTDCVATGRYLLIIYLTYSWHSFTPTEEISKS